MPMPRKDDRTDSLKDEADLQVKVPLREQIIKKLVNKLEDLGEGHRTLEIWRQGNSDRQSWLDRQDKLLREYDEFINPIRAKSQDWESDLHLPIALTQAKTYHARFMAALLGVDPPFTVKARKASNQDRSALVADLMRYAIRDWANYNMGIDEAVDAWLWSWVTRGCGILKSRWERKYTRFVDVVRKERVVDIQSVEDLETGDVRQFESKVTDEVEETVTKKVFDGPLIEAKPVEDILIVGGQGDPQLADEVLEYVYLTKSELYSLADQGIFDSKKVDKIIEAGEQRKDGQVQNAIKVSASENAGHAGLDKDYDLERYGIIERYARIDVDGSGIAADVVLWVASETGVIVRATYLYRVQSDGLRPYFKIDFHKRHGETYGSGIIELLYSLTTEIDAIHNMRIDFGLLSAMPFGFYRPTGSTIDERIPLEPGKLIPLDNPQTDINFPQLGNRTAFTVQEEQALQTQIERLTSISDMSLGIIGGQGAARTATGARALLGEGNANLDVYLRRLNRGWRRCVEYIWCSLIQHIEPGFEFRVFGDNGDNLIKTLQEDDYRAIQGKWDFEFDGNSANSNKAIQQEQAAGILQIASNPLYMQLGIVSPLNLWEALKYHMQVQGVRDIGRFITKPLGQTRVYKPIELLDAALSGVNIPLDPTQDLQGLMDLIQQFLEDEELNGQFGEQHFMILAKKAQEVQGLMQALEAQNAQARNQQQIALNAAQTAPSPQSQGAVASGAPAQVPTE